MDYRVRDLPKLLRGRYRIAWGFCPLCNSDAPELDDCPLCLGYSQASGDPFPPSKELKERWWKEYKGVLRAKKVIHDAVAKSRRITRA